MSYTELLTYQTLLNYKVVVIFEGSVSHYVHPPGGWIYYFCFFRRPMSDVRRPASGVRCPASRMVSAHLKEKY